MKAFVAPPNRRELISFRLGSQEFCVDIMSVKEIRGWTEATPLPHSPTFIRGMVNLRGVVLPIIDMAARLGLKGDEPATQSVVIVVWIEKKLVGLLVDAVCDIVGITDDALQSTQDIADASIQQFISAVLMVESRMLCLVELKRLLTDSDGEGHE